MDDSSDNSDFERENEASHPIDVISISSENEGEIQQRLDEERKSRKFRKRKKKCCSALFCSHPDPYAEPEIDSEDDIKPDVQGGFTFQRDSLLP